MATKVLPVRVCDVCGEPAEGRALRFGWDLINYEIDLCPGHRELVEETMEDIVSRARRLGSPATSVDVPSPERDPRDTVSTPEVRAWALRKGIPGISDRGRIPASVVDQYLEETRGR
jgi:hypothetical protein